MSTFSPSPLAARRRSGLLAALGFLLGIAVLCAQMPVNAPATRSAPFLMKTFVLIFRQNPARERTPLQNQELAAEMPAWVQRQNQDGRKFDPRILGRESAHAGAEKDASSSPGSWALGALLFIEASDLADATRVAESHPALKYGASVEVRPWSAPVPPAPPPAVPATP